MNNDEMSSDEKTKSIIPVIKTELTGSVCENTGSQLTRECPQCHKTLTYTKRKSKLRADKIDGRCRSCAVSETGLTNIGKIVSKETRVRMSKSQRNRITPTPFKGKHHSDEVKRKMRISACKRVLSLQRDKGGRINNIGKNEGKYFFNLEKNKGWDGIFHEKSNRQFFIEHLGYFVDYYEPIQNIVVEYDESQHYKNGSLREKDVRRMLQIKEYLKCRFIRYNKGDGIEVEY